MQAFQEFPLHAPEITICCYFIATFVLKLYTVEDVTLMKCVICPMTVCKEEVKRVLGYAFFKNESNDMTLYDL